MAEVYLTKEAYDELKEKLAHLKSEGRVDVANKIKFARSFGDISENSEYDAAREEEALLEQEIVEIENTLRNAKIITKARVNQDVVNVGATVKVFDKEFNEELTFSIMGSFESDPSKGLISNESPTGKALIGKSVGDVVTVEVPGSNAKISYKILDIKY